MQIDIIDKGLYINNPDPNTFHQLEFWNFIKVENNSYLLNDGAKTTLPKLIGYFEKENVPFSLSGEAQDLLNSIEFEEEKFNSLVMTGESIKNDIYDETDYENYKEFVSSNIHRSLYGHQLKASYHLWKIQNGANFSVPGAGKSSVVLTVYEKLRLEGKIDTLFVVGPTSSFKPWKDEFKDTLGREAKFKELKGGQIQQRKSEYYTIENQYELYLTTPNSLLNDQDDINVFLKNNPNIFFIVDEAHNIKNLQGSWAKAIIEIAKSTKYRCVLTGTPIPHSYSDIFNLFEFLWLDNNPIPSNLRHKLNIFENNGEFDRVSKILNQTIGPLFYRVRKKDLGLKPQIFKEPEHLEMNTIEHVIYEAIKDKIKHFSDEDYLHNIDVIERLVRGRIMRLRQATSFPKLLQSAIPGYDEDLIKDNPDLKNLIYHYGETEIPAKVTRLLELISQFDSQNKKVVIWSNFIGTIKMLKQQIRQSGYNCNIIIGETPNDETLSANEVGTRTSIIETFINPKSGLDILIANPAACAESISLHKTCHNAIYYDLSYNCAQFLQSLDRIHRVGGSEHQESYYYFLQYRNTIEENIRSNLEMKRARMENILDSDYSNWISDKHTGILDEDIDQRNAYKKIFGTD